MFRINKSRCQWATRDGRYYPSAIHHRCPHCTTLVTFAMGFLGMEDETIRTAANCPHCNQRVRVWTVDAQHEGRGGEGNIFMYPSPSRPPREPIGRAEEVPERVRRAYLSAVGAFNNGLQSNEGGENWNLCASLCRRALEGVIRGLMTEGERTQNLTANLKKIAQTKAERLAEPLLTLAEAIRDGGNIGAHFDDEADADQATAEGMLDFLDFLLVYLFVLPVSATELKGRIEALSSTT
jgi:hypothetical protein